MIERKPKSVAATAPDHLPLDDYRKGYLDGLRARDLRLTAAVARWEEDERRRRRRAGRVLVRCAGVFGRRTLRLNSTPAEAAFQVLFAGGLSLVSIAGELLMS